MEVKTVFIYYLYYPSIYFHYSDFVVTNFKLHGGIARSGYAKIHHDHQWLCKDSYIVESFVSTFWAISTLNFANSIEETIFARNSSIPTHNLRVKQKVSHHPTSKSPLVLVPGTVVARVLVRHTPPTR